MIQTDFPPRRFNSFSLQLPELPSVLGSRRGSSISSPDTPEPPDLLVKGESQKKSQTQLDLDTSEQSPERAPEEVDIAFLSLTIFKSNLYYYVCLKAINKVHSESRIRNKIENLLTRFPENEVNAG